MERDVKKEYTASIIRMEWELFDKVQNIGGRASCQDQWSTFQIMRSSQLLAWTPELLSSYQNDLLEAKAAGRNPLSEKYGYMMERTRPEEYEGIRHLLPPPNEAKRSLAASICQTQVSWQEELADRWPYLAHRGRAIHSREDSSRVTSFETYLWGELQTYSERTLRLYAGYVEELKQKGENLNQLILENTVTQYGYHSLDEAEVSLKNAQASPAHH